MLTQLDKDDLETIGLIKFDFLGLKTLTIIDKAVAAINRDRAARGEAAIDIDSIPIDDPKPTSCCRQCKTTAVFQFESLGMRDLIKRLQPDPFDDFTAIVALFRPGPMQMADEFINRKHRKRWRVARLSASEPRRHPEADLRRNAVSRASDAGRADSRRLFARRRRRVAARDGQEKAGRDGGAARGVPCGCNGARRGAGARQSHLRPHGDVRGLRFQQVARGRVRVNRLSNRMAQDAISRKLHGGGADGRSRRHGSFGGAEGRMQALRYSARAARC